MKIELSKLHIRNFKGINEFELNLGGSSATIAGQNGTGKTTVADAFYWLFDDNDSGGQSRFNVLRLNKNGEPVDRLDAIVEAEIFIGSRAHTLRKCFHQKWVKKRGTISAENTGNTTDYRINGLDVSRTEYLKKLAEIIQIDKIRLLSDVHFFCDRLCWQDRRKILFELVSDESDKLPKEFEELFKSMGTLTTEEYIKKLKTERRQIEKNLNSIPAQIEGKQEMMAELKGGDEVKLRDELKTIEDQISAKKAEILAIRSGLQITELKSNLAEVKAELSAVSSSVLSDLEQEIINRNRYFASLNNDVKRCQNNLNRLIDRKSKLADDWRKINAEKYKNGDNCFACGQRLPQEKIVQQKDHFEQKKKLDLSAIDNIAAELIKEMKNEEKQLERLNGDIEKNQAKINALESRRNKAMADLDEKRNAVKQRQTAIEAKIAELSADVEPEINAIEYTLADFEKRRDEINSNLLDITQRDKCQLSIKRKKESLIAFAQQHEGIEKRLYELETVNRKRSEYIEKNINEKFDITSWKLFEHLKNGNEPKEICEPMRDGVPYSSDLNTGSKINVGLDCIKTLSQHYDMICPVFVDNAESVTDWVPEDRQIIKLVVAPNVKRLERLNGD